MPGDAKRKTFAQRCTVATALDVAGDRWTLLILRELLGGPARFQELETSLPGIAKNLLTARLRRLEEDGVVRRVPSGKVALYGLTERGAVVRPVVEALGYWGTKLVRVGPATHPRSVRAIAVALQAILHRRINPSAEREVLELEVAGAPVEVVLGPRPTVTVRPVTEASARVRVAGEVLEDYLDNEPCSAEAFELVGGDPAGRLRLLAALNLA